MNQEVKQIFLHTIRLSYYLGRTNRSGIAVIYANFYFKGKQYRISTGLKVMATHWNHRCHYAAIGIGMSPLDIYNNNIVNQRLHEIDVAFLEKISYFCVNYHLIDSLPEELIKVIQPESKMSRKKYKAPEHSVTDLMIACRRNSQTNERSFNTARTNILDFKKFLEEEKIPDTLECMTKDIAARYAGWLKKRDITVNTTNQRIRALATNLKALTTIVDLDFTYPLPAKLPLVKETITGDEQEDNEVALTEEQVNTLYALQNLTENEGIARDMFCLQCWTGVRVSDVPQVLASKNLKEIQGETFTIFRPEKTKTSKNLRAIIPLSSIFPEALVIVKKYLDKTPKVVLSRKNDYNDLIRSVCRQAGFNEVMTVTVEQGNGKKTIKEKLWERMSSHKGRHTFVTCCKKRGIPETEIIKMTGHASTVQIKKTYDNTDAEDNALLLINALRKNSSRAKSDVDAIEVQPTSPVTIIHSNPQSLNQIIEKHREALVSAMEMNTGLLVDVQECLSIVKSEIANKLDNEESKSEFISAVDRTLHVSLPLFNVVCEAFAKDIPEALGTAQPDPDFYERWTMADIYEFLKTINPEWAKIIIGRGITGGQQYDASLKAFLDGDKTRFINELRDTDSLTITWLCRFVQSCEPKYEELKNMQDVFAGIISTLSYLQPSKIATPELQDNFLQICDALPPAHTNAAANEGVDRVMEVCEMIDGITIGYVMEMLKANIDFDLRRILKKILSREEAQSLISAYEQECSVEQLECVSFEGMPIFAEDVVRYKDDSEYITPLKSKIYDAGDEKFKKLIDYLAQENITNNDETKKLLAYRLTGRNRPEQLAPIIWRTRGNTDNGYDLAYLLDNLYEARGVNLVKKMLSFFSGPRFPQTISQYAKSAPRDFKESLHLIYPDIFLL